MGGDKAITIWLLVHVEGGKVVGTSGLCSSSRDTPEELIALGPNVHAEASRSVWELIAGRDLAAFHALIGKGSVRIGGDFRLFARNAHALLKVAEVATVWNDLEAIRKELGC